MLATTFRPAITIALGLALSATLLADDGIEVPSHTANEQQDRNWEENIDSALDKKVSVKHTEDQLCDFAAELTELTDQLCLIDKSALDDVGIGVDVPLTFHFKDMSVRSVLNHVLHDLDLTWMIRDGALVITTPEEAELQLNRRVFDIADLVSASPGASGEQRDFDPLIELLTSIVAPTTWDVVGGPGTIEPFRGSLVISQTRDVLEKIETLLAQVRAARQLAKQHTGSPPPKAAVSSANADPAAARIAYALDQFIVPEYSDTPLSEVLEDLSRQCDINVVLDTRALDDIGIAADVPVSFHAGRMRVRHVLRHMLGRLDLSTTIRDEALIITTQEEAESCLVSAAYPVADLLGPVGVRDQFGDSRRPAELDHLVKLLTTSVAPCTWDSVGGPGSVATIPRIDVIVVSQTDDVRDQIVDLLAKLRSHLALQPATGADQVADEGPEETRLVIYAVPSAEAKPAHAGKSRDNSNSDQSRHMISGDTILSQMGMGGMGGGGNQLAPMQMPLAVVPESQLLGTIMKLVEPRSWAERSDMYAEVLPGRLLIRHTDAVHHKIEQLLDKLGVPFQTDPFPPHHHTRKMSGGMF